MTRRLNWLIAVVVLLIGIPYYWLLLDNRPGSAPPKPLSMNELRSLAASIPGSAPSAVEVELVGWRRVPGNLFVAGSGLKRKLVAILAWRLPVPAGKPVLIDTGITGEDSKSMQLEVWRADRQAVVDRAMDEAGLILVTHEHPDHEGALAAKGGAPLNQAAALNPFQLRPAPLAVRLGWSGPDSPAARITGTRPIAVAPGIVVIPAPSHSPGSQMVFVRLLDGREFLFTGDIATMAQSWRETRARSRLVGDYIAPEDRAEVYSWLRTIKALKASAASLNVLAGHDYNALFEADRPVGIRDGFDLPQIKALSQ